MSLTPASDMSPLELLLINFDHLEAVPARWVHGRGNSTVRALATADWLLRRKRDGRYLGVITGATMTPFLPKALSKAMGPMSEAQLLREIWTAARSRRVSFRSLNNVRRLCADLGVPSNYGQVTQLPLVPEPSSLMLSGRDRYQRPLWLTREAALAWRRMQQMAQRDGISLEAVSGYRSQYYQWGIFRRKLARGLSVNDILKVNAAPGFSEHHSGRAIDISSVGEPAAEESFEHTPAFEWLSAYAARFGFRLSYPRDNPYGIVYEPWHWCFHA